MKNPFRGTVPSVNTKGRNRSISRVTAMRRCQVYMNFPPANVTHKFQVNGVPTFDTLRAHYRSYRHLYGSNGRHHRLRAALFAHRHARHVTGRPSARKPIRPSPRCSTA